MYKVSNVGAGQGTGGRVSATSPLVWPLRCSGQSSNGKVSLLMKGLFFICFFSPPKNTATVTLGRRLLCTLQGSSPAFSGGDASFPGPSQSKTAGHFTTRRTFKITSMPYALTHPTGTPPAHLRSCMGFPGGDSGESACQHQRCGFGPLCNGSCPEASLPLETSRASRVGSAVPPGPRQLCLSLGSWPFTGVPPTPPG